MKQTKYNTELSLSQLIHTEWQQDFGGGGGIRQGAAANAANTSLNMSHSATIKLPGLASHHHTQHDRGHIVTFG